VSGKSGRVGLCGRACLFRRAHDLSDDPRTPSLSPFPLTTWLSIHPNSFITPTMTTRDDDQDGRIPLLEFESSSEDPIISNCRVQSTSLNRSILTAAILLAFRSAAFLGWTQSQPIYIGLPFIRSQSSKGR
jgi:hypothetical protein